MKYLLILLLLLASIPLLAGQKKIKNPQEGYNVSYSQYQQVLDRMKIHATNCLSLFEENKDIVDCINKRHKQLMEDMDIDKHPDSIIIVW